MEVAVRSYFSAGVAFVGAGTIALSPISPVVPSDMHLPSVRAVSIPVELAAAVNPIQAYLDLVRNTVGNLSSLGQTLLANPAPILQQILANQFATASDLLSALQDSGGQLVQNIGTIVPQQLQEALANLAAGNIVGVGQNLVNIIVQPVLLPVLTLLPAIQSALEKPVANLLAVTQQFTTIAALTGIGVLEPVVSTINATAQAIQNVVDAAGSLDPVGLVSAIVAAPAIVADGMINGFGFDGGVLSPGLGLAGALLQIRNIIAQALGAPAPAAAAKVAAVNEPPAAAAKTVTLSTTSTASDTTKTATKADATTTSDSAAATSGKDAGSAAASGSTDSKSGATANSGSSSATTDSSATTATESKSGTDAGKEDGTKGDSTGSTGAASETSTSTAKTDSGTTTASTTKTDTGSEKTGEKSATK
jgi:hypothetical protein